MIKEKNRDDLTISVEWVNRLWPSHSEISHLVQQNENELCVSTWISLTQNIPLTVKSKVQKDAYGIIHLCKN